MNKRFFAAILALAMVFALLPGTALADAATSVDVGSVTLSDGEYTTDGQTIADPAPSDGYAYFSTAGGGATLTLKNFTLIYNTGHGIDATGDITLQLDGASSITTTGSRDYGVYVTKSLTVTGGGSLIVKSEYPALFGEYVTFTADCGTVNATSNASSAIESNSGLNIAGGNITATAMSFGRDGFSVGHGDFTVSGGTVTATGDKSAIYKIKGNVNLSGGTVTFTGGVAAIEIAIESAGTFSLSGDYATAANRTVNVGDAAPGTAWDETSSLNNSYEYARFAPTALPISITPNTAFPVGSSGGDRTVVVGHGTGLDANNIGTLSVGSDRLVLDTDYTKANGGSVNITLKESWLNSLTAGTHRLNVPVTSGAYAPQTPYINIVVTGTGGTGGDVGTDIPKTGDGSMPYLWAGLALLAGTGLVILRKRRRA